MAAKILVATPLAAFGELIRQSLEEVGRYQVEVTGSAADAIARCHKTLFDLAILDSDLKDAGPIGAFGRAVLELVPRVQLVVIPPDNNPNHPKLGGLKVQAFLNKPFYLPDLIETVEHLLANPPGEAHEGSAPPAVGEQDTHSSSPPAGRPAPEPRGAAEIFAAPSQPASSPAGPGPDPQSNPAGQETSRAGAQGAAREKAIAADLLDQFTPETTAQAALLVDRDGEVVASTGGLPQVALGELSQILARYSSEPNGSDLTRFVRLPAVGRQVMFYATRVYNLEAQTGVTALGLVFEGGTPFSQGRAEAGRLAKALAAYPSQAEPPETTSALPAEEEPPAPELDLDLSTLEAPPPDGVDIPDTAQTNLLGPRPPDRSPAEDIQPSAAAASDHLPETADPVQPVEIPSVSPVAPFIPPVDEWELPEGEEPLPLKLPPLLDDVPPPNPLPPAEPVAAPAVVSKAWVKEASGEPAPSVVRTDLLEEIPPEPVAFEEAPEEPVQKTETDSSPSLEPSTPAEWITADTEAIVPLDLPTEEISLPSLATTILLADRIDPLSTDVYNLAFTCILVPRFPSHFLAGDLADSLSKWLPQICLAYAWRLEGLSIRPEYVQWIVRIPPTTSPATLLKVIRTQTSQRIFDAFPRLRTENTSGEFWAPSYLILSGIQTASASLLREFIRHTRQRQGIK